MKIYGFGSKECLGIEDLSAGLAAAQLKVLMLDGTTEERGFFPHIASRPFRACIYIVAGWPGPFLSLGVGAVGETPCLTQEALDGGVVSAQAAHSWCHCYAFLLPGHKPQFFNY